MILCFPGTKWLKCKWEHTAYLALKSRDFLPVNPEVMLLTMTWLMPCWAWVTELVWVSTLLMWWLICTNDLTVTFCGHGSMSFFRILFLNLIESHKNANRSKMKKIFSLSGIYHEKNGDKKYIHHVLVVWITRARCSFLISSEELTYCCWSLFFLNRLSKEMYRQQRWCHILVLISSPQQPHINTAAQVVLTWHHRCVQTTVARRVIRP